MLTHPVEHPWQRKGCGSLRLTLKLTTGKAEILVGKIFSVKAENNVLVVRNFLVQHDEVVVLLVVVKSLCKSMQLLTVILGCHAQDCWLHKF